MDLLRLEPGSNIALAADENTATHVSVTRLRDVQHQLEDERQRNQRLYDKLQQEIAHKIRWRDRFKQAMGAAPTGRQPHLNKPLISRIDCRKDRPVGIGYLELDAQTPEQAYVAAVRAAREYTTARQDSEDARYEPVLREVEIETIFLKDGVWTAVLRFPMTAAAVQAEADRGE